MTDARFTILVSSIPTTIAAVTAAMIGWSNRQKIKTLDENVDGKLTKFMELIKKSSHAEGVLQEKERDKTGE
jgi:hypothetical protein